LGVRILSCPKRIGYCKIYERTSCKKPIKINFYEWDGNKIPLLLWVDQIGGKQDQNLFEFENSHGIQIQKTIIYFQYFVNGSLHFLKIFGINCA
jgi:hypothetical protein